MSKWVYGELELDCSLNCLKRALSSLMPGWAKHIQTDPSGKLSMYRYSGAGGEPDSRRNKDVTVHLLIPGSGNPNFSCPSDRRSDNDWGFIKVGGKWKVVFADFHKEEAFGLANQTKGEVLRLRTNAMAQLKSFQIISDVSEGTGRETKKRHMTLAIDESVVKQVLTELEELE